MRACVAGDGYDGAMDLLFADNTKAPAGCVVAVAVNAPVWSEYDYVFPEALGLPFIGQRVKAPFGRGGRKVLGFVVALGATPDPSVTLKAVSERLDESPQLTEPLMALARWISQYYVAPLGMVLGAMAPSVVGPRAPGGSRWRCWPAAG